MNSSDLKNARHRAIALKKPEINRNRVVMIYSSLKGFEIVRIKYCQAQTIATISGPVNEVDGEGLQRRFEKGRTSCRGVLSDLATRLDKDTPKSRIGLEPASDLASSSGR